MIAIALAIVGCDDGGGGVTDPEAGVRVDLLATTESLQGHEWPERQDGTLSEAATVERPVAVEVQLGEGRVFTAPSQLTFIHQRQDEVVSVEVQPPAGLADLSDVIDDVEGLVAPLESPIPGDPVAFQDHHSWGDLGEFEDRWSWIDGSMLPTWREHELSLQEDLWRFTR